VNELKETFCWSFTQKGYCSKGDACPWVHPTPEVYAAAEGADQVCRGWVKYGFCQRRESCTWVHPVNQVPVWVPVEMMSPLPEGQHGPMRPMLLPSWVANVCSKKDAQQVQQDEQFGPACGVCNPLSLQASAGAQTSPGRSAAMPRSSIQRKSKQQMPEYKGPDRDKNWRRNDSVRWEDVSDSEDCSTECSGTF